MRTPQEIYKILRDSIIVTKEKGVFIIDGVFGLTIDKEGFYKLDGSYCCPIGSFLLDKKYKHSFRVDASFYLGISRKEVDMVIKGFDSVGSKDPKSLKTYRKIGITLRKFI